MVFQDFRLLEDRTAEENIAFALEVTGAPRDAISARVSRLLTQVGLASKGTSYPKELSGGEQQRVAIARALVNDPVLLVADEPTGNLDDRATRGVFQLLRDINAAGHRRAHGDAQSRPREAQRLSRDRGESRPARVRFRRRERRGHGHHIHTHLMRLTFREVLLGLRRSPLLSSLSVVTIAFSLFAFGLFGLLVLNVDRALRGVEEHVEIVAFIADGTLPEAVSTAMGDISSFPEVEHVEQVSPEQALARARSELPEFQDVFDASFLPPSHRGSSQGWTSGSRVR